MPSPSLSGTMRIRVAIGAVSAALLVLLTAPLVIVALAKGRSLGEVWPLFAIGVGLPALFGALMWWQVRRWRRSKEVRRRQPNKAAARILLFGNLGVLMLASLVRPVSGTDGWQGWVIPLSVVTVGVALVSVVAKKKDPRLHFFRRPDPLPEGQEPEGPPQPPW